MPCETLDIEQTLFLGCTVASFNSNAAWNEQASEVTVVVYKDECEGPKVYWNSTLNKIETNDADPGFVGESLNIVGCPAYFRFGSFEFCGLIQSWEKADSTAALDEYTIKLISPIRLLQNTNLIIGDYTGPLKPNTIFSEAPNNLINVFGYAEKMGVSSPQLSQTSPGFYDFGDVAPDGAIFGTAAGGFGGSSANFNGMQWSVIKNITSILTSANPRLINEWSPHGRITHKGVNLSLVGGPWVNGYGLLGYDSVVNSQYTSEYLIDLTELPTVPSYFRFNGSSISLMEAISRVVQESGYDYYLELLPIRSPSISASGVAKILKVRVISRLVQPEFGQIEDYVENARSSDKLISSSVGRELRDDITSTFLIGGPKQSVYQAYINSDPDGDGDPVNPEDDDMIVPYFGTKSNGDMIMPYLTTGIAYLDEEGDPVIRDFWVFEIETADLNSNLQELALFNPLVITEKELMFSTSMESWEDYIRAYNTESYQSIVDDLPEAELNIGKTLTMLENMYPNTAISARDMVSWEMAYSDIQEEVVQRRVADKDKIYEFISNLANEYYGRKFAIRVPYTSVVEDSESLVKKFSEEPTNDGGWTEVDDVIGLPNGTFYTDFFSDPLGKIGSIARFNGASGLDTSTLDPTSYVIYDNTLYLRGQVEEQYVFQDKSNYLYPRVVFDVGNTIKENENSESVTYARIHMAKAIVSMMPDVPIERVETFANAYHAVGAAHIFQEFGRQTFMPDAVCFGIRSNINNYGPWSSVGPPGGIRVEKNDGLVPWEYGGFDILNVVGQELADAGVSNMQVGELGSVTVAGIPELPLGAELNCAPILQDKHLIENRVVSYESFDGSYVGGVPFSHQYATFDFGFSWDGSYGPNITSISIQAAINGFTTTYTMRTYTPQYGRFAELNASRLKQIGQNKIQINRDIRAQLFRQYRISQNNSKGATENIFLNSTKQRAKALRKALAGNTPHEILVGQILPWQSGDRSIIASESIREAIGEMGTGTYGQKAFMSLDGLIRPISLGGDGGLPRYANVTGSGSVNTTQTYLITTGFILTGIDSGNSAGLITVRDLNPLSNPTGYEWSHLSSKHSGTKGHDIDIVGRGTGVPSGGMILRTHENGTGYDYRDDYRAFALRGPLLLHGWGYTTDGKPIPNEADTYDNAASGIFKTSGLTDRFLPDFLQKSNAWPMGPLDARFDVGRGVWTVQNNEQTQYCQIMGHLGKGFPVLARMLDSGTFKYDETGLVTGYSAISGYTQTENIYASGTNLLFKYSSSLSRWEVAQDSEVTILITGTVSGATWDRNITGVKPYRFSMPIFQPHYSTGGLASGFLQYHTGMMVTGWNRYTEGLTPGTNSAYIAKITNGWLDGTDCRKVTYQ
jgi:hypothetical protein